MTESAPEIGGLRVAGASAQPAGQPAPPRELLVRHARKEGRSVATLKAVDHGDSCIVEAEVFPQGGQAGGPVRPGPYTFADVQQATAFVTEAVEALMYLGCDVSAS